MFGQIAQRGSFSTKDTLGTNISTLTINKPTGVVSGDVLIVSILQNETDNDNGGLAIPALTGWTLVDGRLIRSEGTANGDNAWFGAILYRVADGTEGSSFTFTFPTARAEMAIGSMVAFSGVTPTGGFKADGTAGGPFDVDPGSLNLTNAGTSTALTVTTATANAAVVMLSMVNNDRTFSNWVATNPATLTELYDNVTALSDDGSVGAAWALRSTAGATGNGTVTLSGSDRSGAMFLVLRPLPCNAPSAPGSITTPSTLCAGSTGNSFSIAAVAGAGSYQWTATGTGWAVTAGQGSTNATITIGSGSGSVAVSAVSACGASSLATSTGTLSPSAVPTINVGPALNAICRGGTSAELGGSVGGTATGGTWSASVAGGSFAPDASTLNATYTPPAAFTGSVTLTLTSSGGSCGTVSGSKTLTVTLPASASISYSATSYCNTLSAVQNPTLTGASGGTYTASPAGLSITSAGAINPSASSANSYTVTYSIPAQGGCSSFSTSTQVTILNNPDRISYPQLSYCITASSGSIACTRTAPAGGSFSATPAGLSLNPVNGEIQLGTSAPGIYEITYTYAGGVCGNTVRTNLTLYAQPVVTAPADFGACLSSPAFQLTGGVPGGGIYSGPGVAGGFFNPSNAGVGTHAITYTVTGANGCVGAASFSITVASAAPSVTAVPNSNFVYSGNVVTINLTGSVPGTQYTWTATTNNPSITGFSSQATAVPGPISQQVNNPSTSVGEITYVITPRLVGCTGPSVTIVISMPSVTFCESPGTFQAGSCIIDMGVKPQTYANGIKPYGLVYQLVNVNKVPVYWAINPDKDFPSPWPKSDPADFTLDGVTYRGGPFIVPAGYLSQVQSVIDSWVAQGVVVRYSSSSFTPPYFELITRIPRVVLDAAFGNIVRTGFYNQAGIPAEAYTLGGIPSAVTNCDDIYVLPHAEPQNWPLAQRDSLWNFINNRGWLFSSCYAVSFIENLSGSGSRRLNFLSNNGLIPYNQHGNPTLPYSYSTGAGVEAAHAAADPFMQFVDTIDRAINNDGAFEKIYVPNASGWRSSTRIAVYKSNYTNNGTTYPNSAAILAYGRAFGDNNKGMVMYLSGHDFESGVSQSDNVAKARIYGNFLLRSGIGTRPRIVPVSIPASANSGQTITLQVSIPPSTSTIATTEWISDLNGLFTSNSTTTTFTAPTVDVPTNCTVQFKVTDACGRVGLFCTTILINPTITNNFISTAQTICSGTVPASLSGTLPVGPGGGALAYQWLVSTTNASTGYVNAPGASTSQNYTPAALTQTSWFRRRVTKDSLVVFSSPIQVTVSPGPELTAQPNAINQGVCQGGVLSSLTVTTSTSPVSYQWFSNAVSSNTGGSAIPGATGPAYSPSSALQGTLYYYCELTNAAGCKTRSNVSGAVNVFAGLQITGQPNPANQDVCAGQPFSTLTVQANGSGLSYQWHRNTVSSNTLGTPIPGATGPSYTPAAGSTFYYYVLVGAPNSGCNPAVIRSNVSGLMSVKPLPIPVVTNNTGSNAITCDTRTISLTASGGQSYTWTPGNGNSANLLVSDSGTYQIRVTGANGCFKDSSIRIDWGITGAKWTGEYSAEWDEEANWCGGVPTDTTDVEIPAGTPNDPVISGHHTAKVRNLSLASGVQLTLDDDDIQVFGNIISPGSINAVNGTVELKGAVPQSIRGSMFVARRVHTLRLSNPLGVVLEGNQDTLRLTGQLEFGAGNVTLQTNGNLTLVSDAGGTARVDDMTAGGLYVDNQVLGDVTVERYIPLHPKAWQLMSVPTSGQTIRQAWQEGNVSVDSAIGNIRPGYGTLITGGAGGSLAGAQALGFDLYTPAAGSSLKTYSFTDSSWISVGSTNQPLSSSSGYMLFVRGDRSVTRYNQPATATTLRTTGTLYQPLGTPPQPVSVTADRFQCVGNPYASAIDFSRISRSGGVQDLYYVWDPNLTAAGASVWGLGGYQCLIPNGAGYTAVPGGGSYGSNAVNIQSGQAFFVRSVGQGGSISFSESAKAEGSALVTRSFAEAMQIRANLQVMNGNPILLDGVLSLFDSSFQRGLDGQDALKLAFGSTENLAIAREGQRLFAEKSSLQTSDTLQYDLRNLRRTTYRLDVMIQNLAQGGMEARLIDRFTGVSTVLGMQDTTHYAFTVTTDPLSARADRFYVVFRDLRLLPLRFRDIYVRPTTDKLLQLGWSVEQESDIRHYQPEVSTDGVRFQAVASVVSPLHTTSGLAQYKVQGLPSDKGTQFFRIRAVMGDGTYLYSPVVQWRPKDVEPSVSVYPNPIVQKIIQLHYRQLPEGSYHIRISDKQGRTVYQVRPILMQPSGVLSISLPESVSSGGYDLVLTDGKGFFSTSTLVVQ